MQRAEPLLVGAVLLVEAHAPVAVEQVADHPDDPRRVEHVQRRRLYSGAIRTAVCCFDVVAPPIRSGSSIPRRSISFATWTISSREGVIRPERPTMSQSSSSAVSRIRSAGTMTPRSMTS